MDPEDINVEDDLKFRIRQRVGIVETSLTIFFCSTKLIKRFRLTTRCQYIKTWKSFLNLFTGHIFLVSHPSRNIPSGQTSFFVRPLIIFPFIFLGTAHLMRPKSTIFIFIDFFSSAWMNQTIPQSQ